MMLDYRTFFKEVTVTMLNKKVLTFQVFVVNNTTEVQGFLCQE